MDQKAIIDRNCRFSLLFFPWVILTTRSQWFQPRHPCPPLLVQLSQLFSFIQNNFLLLPCNMQFLFQSEFSIRIMPTIIIFSEWVCKYLFGNSFLIWKDFTLSLWLVIVDALLTTNNGLFLLNYLFYFWIVLSWKM